MRLDEIRLARVPGIDEPFAVAPGPGLTVVSGPNASGKTSVVRAVRALLWPRLERARPLVLRARWTLDGAAWTVERDDRRVAWQREGADVEPPPLPGEHLARCFVIGAEDLLALDAGAPEQKDRELAEAIARAMLGGFDLNAVRARFQLRPREGATEEKALRAARHELRRVQHAHAALAHELEGRPALERRLAAARAADGERRRTENALALAAARRELRAVVERLGRFPGGMDRLGEREPQRARELGGDVERDECELAGARRAVEEARAALAALPAAPADERALRELDERVERLRTLENELARLGRERAERDELRAELGARLGVDAGAAGPVCARPADDTDGAARTPPADLARLEQFLRRSDELARRRAALEARLTAQARAGEQPAELADLLAGQAALGAWLRAVDEDTLLRWRLCIGGLAVLAAAGATALAVLHHGAWALLGAPALALWIVALRGEVDAASARRRAARAFLAAGLEPPLVWERDEVEDRLREVQEELGRANVALEHAALAADVRRELDALELEQEDLDAQRDALEREVGARVPGDLALASVFADVSRWRAAHDARAEAAGAETAARRELDAERERVAAILARQGLDATGAGAAELDARGAAAAMLALRSRAEARRRAREELARAEGSVAELEPRARASRERRAAFFEALGLADGDEDELARRAEALPSWRAEREREIRARAEVERLEAELGQDAALLEEPLEALRARAEELAERANELERLVQELASLGQREKEARVRTELAEAIAAVRDAERALAEQRRRALEAAAGAALVAAVDHEHGRAARPEILRRAQELFAAFTRHAFELVVERRAEGGAPPVFRAVEAASGRGRALHELSSATRMQLLLAARLAFVEDEEKRHGARLPLIFDEALSMSDPARFRAVAEALRILVEAGDPRQVLYFTSDPADVARFRAAGGDVAHVDLAAVRRLSSAAGELPPLEVAPAVPDPRGQAPEAWARRLGVPPLDPRGPLEGVHLFYVLRDDLELLRRLLELGVERWGQLRVLRETSGTPAWLDAPQAAAADAWARVVEEVFAAWRVGRGAPVTREALAAAGISDRYLAGLAEMSDELNGEAAALVDALEKREDERTKRLRSSKVDDLRRHLESEGHLDPRPRLSRDHARARVLDALRLDLDRGVLLRAELRARFEWLWDLCDPRGHVGPAPALPFPDAPRAPTRA